MYLILRAGYSVGRSNQVRSPSCRCMATNLNRPSPPPLPREQQREFEQLLRNSQTPLAAGVEVTLDIHPHARKPLKTEFEGNVNPITGEEGGPKREPVGRWGEDPGGDWSFKGRVSDF